MRDQPVPHLTGPFGAVTEPFWMTNRRGAVIRGLLHRVAPDRQVAGRHRRPVIVAPGLGVSRRRSLLPALHLLANGFDVLSFDPTNAVGLSDGDITDFTLSGLCDDIRDIALWARDRFGADQVDALAASIAARTSIRAAACERGLFHVVGMLSCVVDVRATLTDIQNGVDVVARWHAGSLDDPDATGTLFGHEIRLRGLAGLVAQDWTAASGTLRDLRAATGTSFVNFHGACDPWVRTEHVHATFGPAPHARVVVLDDCTHDFTLAQLRLALAGLIAEYAPDAAPAPPLTPSADDLFAQSRIERTINRWWAGVLGEHRAQRPALATTLAGGR